MKRLHQVVGHFNPQSQKLALSPSQVAGISKKGDVDPKASLEIDSLSTLSPAQNDANPIRWNGWGYRDTSFRLNEKGLVEIAGDRYLGSGKTMPNLRSWMESYAGLDISLATPPQRNPKIPEALVNQAFVDALDAKVFEISTTPQDRLFHGHGHTCHDIYTLRFGEFKRIPDMVVYPHSTQQVEAIMKLAVEHNVVIIPYGGGTSVTDALACPEKEKRMILSLDMHRMNNVKWVNRKSMLACIEAGVVGKDLEKKLESYGLCLGHEPDSAEFSTLGGWVATRASGMRKNAYGNIEDIVRRITVVTPTGTLVRDVISPRISAGPDINEIIMGSEGTLGVITEVVVRLSERPPLTRYGSIVFPNFELGVECMHELTMKKATPVSIRLVDNPQFQFSQALKPEQENWVEMAKGKLSKWYVLNKLKFDPEKMVAATLLFEGTSESVARQEKIVYEIAKKYGGIKGGEENGVRGYFLTYMIAYLRDFGFEYSFLAESFETSVPWDNVIAMTHSVKHKITEVSQKLGVSVPPFVSARVTQTYDSGAVVYFYLGFIWKGLEDPVDVFNKIEHAARVELMKFGGSISHHHGIGKLRKEFMEKTISPVGIKLLQGVKSTLDPKNIMGNGNLIDL